ncbi:MAG TPA: NlpC/P60 family protein [Atopobiaceae bacterium]|nr:NlpC/P60 family protein [Atopobiaceae bacterium]
MLIRNKLCSLICAFLLAFTSFFAFSLPSLAVPTQADLDAARAHLEELGQKMSATQSSLMEAAGALETTRNKIDETNASIEKTQAELTERRDILGKRMRSSYKSGSGTILDLVLGARDFEDIVNVIYYIDKMSESDARAIDEIQQLERQLEEQKAELEATEKEQEGQIAEIESQLQEYDAQVAEAQAYYDQLDAEIQAELARQAEEEARRQAEQEAAAQNSGLSTVVDALDAGNSGSYDSGSSSSSSDSGSDSSSSSGNSIVASSDVIANAYQLVGMPYKTWWSGRNYGPDASGYDCCGLVATSYQMAGYSTPYATSVSGLMSWVQGRGNWKSCNLSNYQNVLNPGDIIFCSTGHVAIYLGGEYMIHAPYPGQYVCVARVYDCIGGGFGG